MIQLLLSTITYVVIALAVALIPYCIVEGIIDWWQTRWYWSEDYYQWLHETSDDLMLLATHDPMYDRCRS